MTSDFDSISMVPPIEIQMGSVSLIIEPESGQLRYVRVGGEEIIRGIYAAVRDRNWGTVPANLARFTVQERKDGFKCTFAASHQTSEIGFNWIGRIEGSNVNGEATIEYEMEGEVSKAFDTCRTGVCVLHPRTIQGTKAEVEHTSSPCSTGSFPVFVQPDQPFKDIKAITHPLGDGTIARIEFFGEVFEMEDQRNWADPSYKTYCRPQEWGSPYSLKQGQKIQHRIKITLSGTQVSTSNVISPMPIQEKSGKIPSLGTFLNRNLTDNELTWIKALKLGHAMCSQTGLEIAKRLDGRILYRTSIANIPSAMSPNDWLCLTPPQSWQKLHDVRGAKRAATSDGNFVDLNRCRPTFEEIEAVCYPMNPQIHAFDLKTIFEATWTLPDQVMTCKNFGAKSVSVGPLTLRSGPVDPRSNTIVGALFALSAIAHLSTSPVDHVTLFDFDSLKGSPAELVIRLLAADQNQQVKVFSIDPEFVAILGSKTILANLSWKSTERFKELPIDSAENLRMGIRGSYRLFTSENIHEFEKVMNAPASHHPLTELPAMSFVVIG